MQKQKLTRLLLVILLLMTASSKSNAQEALSPLHVDGPYLVNAKGERVVLHGFAQTYSPWFNEQGTKWSGLDVDGCLSYNKGLIDQILAAGWKMDFCRLHMDPHWSNVLPSGVYYVPESDIRYFDFDRFKKYLDEVFVPMANTKILRTMAA